jgi:hypothetical protein
MTVNWGGLRPKQLRPPIKKKKKLLIKIRINN